MYARRFLIVVTILTLLAVAGAVLFFEMGGSVLLRSATPKGHFVGPPPNSGPDYSSLDSWIARPDIPHNAAEWRPEGYPPSAMPRRVAAFYVHPTTYLRADRWNAPLYEHESGSRDQLFVQSQASAFNTVADLWAPRYRQAAYGAFLLDSDDAAKALDLAYSDVSAAFDEFLRRIPPGEPIILAGHSQGALHLIRLLKDRNSQLKRRLVAAYVVGWPLDTKADLPALGFPACAAAGQTGCILSWMTFGDPPNPDLILSNWRKAAGFTGGERKREDILCVNPITGTRDGAAPPSANPGSLVPNADFTGGRIVAGAVGAHCDKGLLIVDGQVPNLGPFVLPGNNYHVYDYALFWWPIARDALRRSEAWQR